MKVIKNELSDVPKIAMDIDNISDLPYIPIKPLPTKSFAIYIVGAPASGKSNLLLALLMSHPTKKNPNKPLYYHKFFDRIELISGSLQTLPEKVLDKLPEEQQHNHFSDELLNNILLDMKQGENINNLIVLDDCIKDLNRSKTLCKMYLNRRHVTHDADKSGHGGLAILTTGQKYNMLNLEVRCNQSHYVLFKSSNRSEIDFIVNELMTDLSKEEQTELLKMAWKDKYSFLFIDVLKPKEDKYYIKFDKVIFTL
jgi:hypothetical protein